VEQQGEAANELSIKIKSDSEFNTFVDESKKLIYSTDFFNSLLFEAQLIKTKAMGLLLRNIVQNFLPDMQHFFAIYDKLKNLNLDLKHASARTLPNVLRNTAATEAVPTADYLKFMQLSELIDNTVPNPLTLGPDHSLLKDLHGSGQHLPAQLRQDPKLSVTPPIAVHILLTIINREMSDHSDGELSEDLEPCNTHWSQNAITFDTGELSTKAGDPTLKVRAFINGDSIMKITLVVMFVAEFGTTDVMQLGQSRTCG
jgi:hypothetical protein